MKRLALLMLISAPFLLGSCSNKNIARVENDDVYFTHKDRKRAKEAEKLATTIIFTVHRPIMTRL